MQFKDYYETLGVKPEASAAEIKTAYRRMARKFHPDVSKETGAEDRFKAVNEAHEVLGDETRRAEYDQLRANGFRGGQDFRPSGPQGFDFNSRQGYPGQDGAAGFSDFFESLFGRGRPPGQPGAARRAPDQLARIQVDLETVFAGGKQRVRVDGKTLEISIPRGITPGQQIRLSGQASGGGNLRLEISYRPHPQFQVDGKDVVHTLKLAPWEAALGADISVPTLGGSVQLKIPPGSDSGKRLRLRGRGLVVGAETGDQIVELSVRAPPARNDAERALYEQMAEVFGFDPRAT
jgi:curved DNA-binding protein